MAYVDGELDAETTHLVETRVQHDPELARKVRQLRENAALVRACVNEPIHDPVPEELIKAVGGPGAVPAHRPRRRWLIAAGIAALVSGSFGAGYLLRGAGPAQGPEMTADAELVDEIVAYHASYAALPPGIVTEQPDPAVMEKWLTEQMHQKVRIPDLGQSGFRFKAARLFLYEDKPIAQIVYQSPAGIPVALCIVASSEGGGRPFEALHREGFTLIVWRRAGSDYIVIGALPQAQLQRLSTEIATGL